MTLDDSALHRIVDASGFAFQLAIEQLVSSVQSGWSVAVTEHAWKHPRSDSSGFIDALLEYGRIRLVIECKRTRDGEWIFLAPQESTRIETIWTGVERPLDPKKPERLATSVERMFFNPKSPQSTFCTVRGTGENQKPLLERLAGTLIEATESVAEEQMRVDLRALGTGQRRLCFYFPVIVTNAQLYTCSFSAADIDLQTGRLPDTATFAPATCVRFFKNLTTDLSTGATAQDLKAVNQAKNRTVLILNASGLVEFLRSFNSTGDPLSDVLRSFL